MRTRNDVARRAAWAAAACAIAALLAVSASLARAFPAPRLGLEAMLSGGQSWYPEVPPGASDLMDDKIAGGYALGGTAAWRLTGPFAFETGLRYSLDTERRDYSYSFLGGSYEFMSRTRLHRLGVPARLRIALPWVRGLSAEAGAETQYLLQARRDDEASGSFGGIMRPAAPASRVGIPSAIIFERYTGQGDITGFYPRWNLTLGGGLGWDFPLGRVTGALRGRYQLGVSDQTKTPYAKDYSRVAEMGLGVRW